MRAPDEPLECVLVRSDQEAVVVNLDLPVVEKPETVFWVDPIHAHPHDPPNGSDMIYPVRSATDDCRQLTWY